jgi:predicted N-acetyltransferase YhbS
MNQTDWSHLRPGPRLLERTANGFAIGPAVERDFPAIYMMGFDVWGGEWTETQYVTCCHASAKYSKGTWHCARDSNGELAASAITYRLGVDLRESVIGVGSLATEPGRRHRGIASIFLRTLLREYEAQHDVDAFLLFADRETTLYARAGFELPATWQAAAEPIPMIRWREGASRGAAFTELFIGGLRYF